MKLTPCLTLERKRSIIRSLQIYLRTNRFELGAKTLRKKLSFVFRSRVLQIIKTTRTIPLSRVFGPPKCHKTRNWPVLGRFQNLIPKTESQFCEFSARFCKFLDLNKYFASFWTSKLGFGFGNRVLEPNQNRPVSANSKKFQFCRTLS